ncbi:dihydropteroate synthase [Actibacterium ureilyticum]|uniref:dihydropteroate synthase n=1 Tax=Actibacterium ureilyticum TaxID=1590614 RepID=UPI000BAAC6F0|nr:dihydropteroate synthase [Actibacterium ureilyticum]
MRVYYRPLVQTGPDRPIDALPLAGGTLWFTHAERLERGAPARFCPASELPDDIRAALMAPRAPVCGLAMDRPRLMGILNVTPDSFSDGGLFDDPEAALAQGQTLIADGAEILDIGGESTRPGAELVPADLETRRTAPVIAALRAGGITTPISIDTRKSDVARAALEAGADLINDVAAFTFDPNIARLAADSGTPVCVMHAQGDPKTMQDAPDYANVLLDVYDFLEERVDAAVASGIPRDRVIVDPGIGFGKTLDHNLALIRGLSLFHGLGCPVLLGASRKRFIGTLGDAPQARDRMPGSVAIALEGARQGVQILRVHDISETRQALRLAQAVWGSSTDA